jgi:excisionase family DNA binding protein
MANGPKITRMEPPGDLISKKRAAELVGVHPRTVQRWIDTGRLRAYRVGGRTIRISVADLAEPARPGDEQSA